MKRQLDSSSESWWRTSDGNGRSVLAPTNLLEQPCLGFIRFPVGPSQSAASVPTSWGAVDRAGGWLSAYAVAQVWDIVEQRAPSDSFALQRVSPIMAPREVHRVLTVLHPVAVESYYDRAICSETDRRLVSVALAESVPKGMRRWWLAYCADFWRWLEEPGGDATPDPGSAAHMGTRVDTRADSPL